jgi:hypothetical protein
MLKEQGIFWLASYPKSGNTWFRSFLQNLQADAEEPVHINELATGQIASSRQWLDETLGFDSADLYPDEIERLRPQVYAWRAVQESGYHYHKIHDACWQLASGDWLVSQQATVGALYIVRNPLDVAISFANHNNSSIDQAIEKMNDPGMCFCKDKRRSLKNQTEQRLLSWSQHVASWVDSGAVDTLVMRYEDMKHTPLETFTRAATFLRLPTEPEKIAKALRFCDFRVLQAQESTQTFKERPPNTERFFRKGVAGDWQQTLTPMQIDKIVSCHHAMMQRFGYLDAAGNPQVM